MPSSAVFGFTDPYEYQEALRAAAVNIIITRRGTFKAELTRIDLNGLWMQRGHESLPRVAHVVHAASRRPIVFLTQHSQANLAFGRTELQRGEIMRYVPGSEHYQRSYGPTGWGAMSLSPDDLGAAGRAIADCDLAAPKSDRTYRPPAQLMTRLLRLHEAAGQLAITAPEMLAHSEVARAIEQELIRVMVGCLVEGTASERDQARYQRIPVLRRLEQLLEANSDRPLYLAEVCAAIGVPARTLRQHCMEHLGMGPHRYLWLRRMNLARRSLAWSDSDAQTVTAIANDHGFAELGRFAVAYRKLFGEAPSATLRRPREHAHKIAPDDPIARLPILP